MFLSRCLFVPVLFCPTYPGLSLCITTITCDKRPVWWTLGVKPLQTQYQRAATSATLGVLRLLTSPGFRLPFPIKHGPSFRSVSSSLRPSPSVSVCSRPSRSISQRLSSSPRPVFSSRPPVLLCPSFPISSSPFFSLHFSLPPSPRLPFSSRLLQASPVVSRLSSPATQVQLSCNRRPLSLSLSDEWRVFALLPSHRPASPLSSCARSRDRQLRSALFSSVQLCSAAPAGR